MIFSIQTNLLNALKYLRSGAPQWTDQKVIIWIDALCIDRSDILERSHQLGMMAGIYGGSAETVAWLGEIGQHGPPATESFEVETLPKQPLDEPHEAGCHCQDAYWERVPELPSQLSPIEICAKGLAVLRRMRATEKCEDYQLCRIFGNEEEMLPFHLSMDFLSNNLWFTRAWIVQLCLHRTSPYALVMFGSSGRYSAKPLPFSRNM